MNDVLKNKIVKVVLIIFLIFTSSMFLYYAIERNDLFAIILSSIYGIAVLFILTLLLISKIKKASKNK